MNTKWPELSYEKGKKTYATLHMWTQIIGKIKLAIVPWINHSWHITLHLTPTGLTTRDMFYNDKNFQIDFDFFKHQLRIVTSAGEVKEFDLEGNSVAEFYEKTFAALKDLEINIEINTMPVELENPVRFEEDTQNKTYEKDQVSALFHALLKMQNVMTHMRCNFLGKCSPVHFFWGSFDLAVSRFSGRTAPKHPGGVPNLADWVAEEAYSHEVSSFGFWPGSEALPDPSFYAYLYPAPEGYDQAEVQPKGAYFHKKLGEFILPYSLVQQAENPEEILTEFMNSTFEAGAKLADWTESL